MESQKNENLLNLALQTPEAEREKSLNLNVGYDPATRRWELIVKYNGDLPAALASLSEEIRHSLLIGQYAILNVPQIYVDALSGLTEIEFIEKPKRLSFSLENTRRAACVNEPAGPPDNLSGRGTILALVDSGVDVTHPDFRNPDGSTRLLYLWDQSAQGTPPSGYFHGREYGAEEINRLINENVSPYELDPSGHGTAVLGVAAGNGAASGGRYRGMAPNAAIIAVKLGVSGASSFPRTTELMEGVDYCLRKALSLQLPVAVNLSFGNNYGSHDGNSLVETYLDAAASFWKNVICIGTGNEGAAGGHFAGLVGPGETQRAEFVIGPYETTLNVQLWKNYVDQFSLSLTDPSGQRISFSDTTEIQRYQLPSAQVLVYHGTPKPYTQNQEIYVDLLPTRDYLTQGTWFLDVTGRRVTVGAYDLWLPVSQSLSPITEFLRPSPINTLTVPSGAREVITVGAYDAATDSYADFSGRGVLRSNAYDQKPDLVAPGVGIRTTTVGGGYGVFSGTSFSTPVVSGISCLMMEYGITQNRDAYLYGQKIKAHLHRGARKLPGYAQWPNQTAGYGAVCLRDSLI